VRSRARGESLREGSLTKALVQAGARANRCEGSRKALQTCNSMNPSPSGTARCWVAVAERLRRSCKGTPGDTARWKALWVERPFGSAGELALRATEGARGGSYRSAWNRSGGARGVTGSVRGRFRFGEGSSSHRGMRRRGGSASKALRGAAARECSRAVLAEQRNARAEGASSRSRAKRARANSKRSPLRVRPRERFWLLIEGSYSKLKVRGNEVQQAEDPAKLVISK